MQLPSAEIFSQGEEVVCGDIADTNAAWLSRELTGLGFEVRRHTAVGDRLESLVALLREIRGRASLCLANARPTTVYFWTVVEGKPKGLLATDAARKPA